MKKILITGVNSYVGNNLKKWLLKEPSNYKVDTISLRNEKWKEKDFSSYDSIVHVAGIAHIKETKENRHLYYEVNRDLAYEVAKKAKNDSVKQFVFLSSMSVYGLVIGVIDRSTPLNPKTAYGKSKKEAEELIIDLKDNKFKIAIIRPPMIYGKGCKGNYPKLAKLAIYTPIFPNIENKRSMIYIDNLSEFLKLMIDNEENGLFCPQNKEYVNTSEMVKLIAKVHGKKIILTKIFNMFFFIGFSSVIDKIFGNLIYDISMKNSKIEYDVSNFYDSIFNTENGVLK